VELFYLKLEDRIMEQHQDHMEHLHLLAAFPVEAVEVLD